MYPRLKKSTICKHQLNIILNIDINNHIMGIKHIIQHTNNGIFCCGIQSNQAYKLRRVQLIHRWTKVLYVPVDWLLKCCRLSTGWRPDQFHDNRNKTSLPLLIQISGHLSPDWRPSCASPVQLCRSYFGLVYALDSSAIFCKKMKLVYQLSKAGL